MKKTLLLLLFTVTLYAQKLPRSTPENQGVSSLQIAKFIEAWENSPNHEPHSFMILRHGKIIVDGWWKPYKPELLHTMYSVSKSFTATAVGFAIAEGKLKLSDPVYSFFPEKNPVNVSELQNKLTVKDLLTMSTGQQQEPIYMMAEDDWVNAFLRAPITHEPGTRFMYNSPATYMLSAILQKVTGERLFDYLQTRLFEPLDIKNIDWEVDPNDINTGGWGLRLKTEDMAKFGQLFLQNGVWNEKQVLPKGWVEEASKAQIFQPEPVAENLRKNSDWYQGYGYQMWRGQNNTYRADGAYGQNIIVLPEKDAVIITTGESTDLQGLLDLIWTQLLPAFSDSKTKKVKLKPLALSPVESIVKNDEESAKYVLLKPHGTLKSIELNFSAEQLQVTFGTDSVNHTIPFGKNKWIESETSMKGPYIFPKIKANRSKIASQKVAASYGWKSNQTLQLSLKYIESLHTENYTLTFDGNNATIDFSNVTKSSEGHKAIKDNSKASSPKLIIRGDDMGYSHSGNVALMKSSLEGIQTSIEVLAAAPWFPEAVKMLKEYPQIDVGLHFTLTSEWDNIKWRPLTEAKTLRDPDGYFYPMIGKNSYYPNLALMDHNYDLKDIEIELRAQIELLKKHIPYVSHITGHMGCTMFTPEVKEMVRKVAKEYNLPVMDSDAFYDYGVQYVWIDSRNKNTEERIDAFIKLLDKLEENKSYVFLEHPGLDNEELRAIHHIGYENVAEDRQAVTDLFTSEKVKKAIYEKGIKLLSYKEILNK